MRKAAVAKVSEDEVLLLWRALMAFRSDKPPTCQATGKAPRHIVPSRRASLAGQVWQCRRPLAHGMIVAGDEARLEMPQWLMASAVLLPVEADDDS